MKYYIGIDPGRNTGFCLYERLTKKIVKLELLDFWETVQTITNIKDAMVIIEDPQLNKPVFNRGLKGNANLKVAQDVGRNKEQAFLLIEYMRKSKIPFRQVQPRTEKWDHKYFVKLTKWDGSSNEHVRDAARLVWGL